MNINDIPRSGEASYILRLAEVAYIMHARSKQYGLSTRPIPFTPWHKLTARNQLAWVDVAKTLEHVIRNETNR